MAGDLKGYGSSVVGLAGYRPSRLITNDALVAQTTVSNEWIVERTGILTRHYAGPDESIIAMAAEAGRKALAMANVDYADVGLVILATATRTERMPAEAPRVASEIGLPAAGAFDLNAVCAGFAYALAMGANAVRSGDARHVLVVASERTSDWLNPNTPDTFVIFGDGAGAAVVSRSDTDNIGPVVWGSDGKRAHVISTAFEANGFEYVTMDGPLVYKWSTSKIPPVAHKACERFGVSLSDIDWLVPHQANRRIVDTLTRVLGFPEDRVARDVVDTGNTSGASIPLALSRLHESGRMSPGDLVLLLGFGAGLSFAGQVIRLP